MLIRSYIVSETIWSIWVVPVTLLHGEFLPLQKEEIIAHIANMILRKWHIYIGHMGDLSYFGL